MDDQTGCQHLHLLPPAVLYGLSGGDHQHGWFRSGICAHLSFGRGFYSFSGTGRLFNLVTVPFTRKPFVPFCTGRTGRITTVNEAQIFYVAAVTVAFLWSRKGLSRKGRCTGVKQTVAAGGVVQAGTIRQNKWVGKGDRWRPLIMTKSGCRSTGPLCGKNTSVFQAGTDQTSQRLHWSKEAQERGKRLWMLSWFQQSGSDRSSGSRWMKLWSWSFLELCDGSSEGSDRKWHTDADGFKKNIFRKIWVGFGTAYQPPLWGWGSVSCADNAQYIKNQKLLESLDFCCPHAG